LSQAALAKAAYRKSELAGTVVALERPSLEKEASFMNSRFRAV
jgi:hypothetical protein